MCQSQIFNITNMSFNAICENEILLKILNFQYLKTIDHLNLKLLIFCRHNVLATSCKI